MFLPLSPSIHPYSMALLPKPIVALDVLSKVSVRLCRLILTRHSPPEECHILIGLKQNKGSEQSTAVTGINYLLPNGSQTPHSAILVFTLFLLPHSSLSSLCSPPHHVFVIRLNQGFSLAVMLIITKKYSIRVTADTQTGDLGQFSFLFCAGVYAKSVKLLS